MKFDEDFFKTSRDRVKFTKKQRRQECQVAWRERTRPDTPGSQESQWTREELQRWQKEDESLETVRREVRDQSSLLGSGFYVEKGLIYRQWVPPSQGEDMAVKQLMLLIECRATILKVAHSIPMAGHLGKTKTASQILQWLYWPTLFKDVGTYLTLIKSK